MCLGCKVASVLFDRLRRISHLGVKQMTKMFSLFLLADLPPVLFGQINLPSPTAPSAVNNGVSISESWTANSSYSLVQYTLVQRDVSAPTTQVVPAASDVLGVTLSSTSLGTPPTVQVARYGQVLCLLDGSSTAGDLAVMSTTNPTKCLDPTTGNVNMIPISTRVVGYFLQSVSSGSGAMALVELTPGLMGAAVGTSATSVPVWATTVNASSVIAGTVSTGTTGTAGCLHLYDNSGNDTMLCSPSTHNGDLTINTVAVLLSGGALGTPSSGTLTNATGLPLSTGVSGQLPAANGGTGVNNTATLTLGTSNQNWGSLGTGIVKNTTGTGALSDAAAADVYGLWSGTCSGSTFLNGAGACATPAGTGANALGSYLVAGSANAPANAVDLGGLSAGILRQSVSSGVSAPSASELSGDCTTSGTNAITCTKTGGTTFAAAATNGFLLAAQCSGAVPNSTGNVYLYPGGSATSCNTATSVEGVPMPFACTASTLVVRAGTAGNADVVTLYKNGASTAVTCTLPTTGTIDCSDPTHSVSFSQLDGWAVGVAVTASDNLAQVRASFLCK